MFSHYPNKEGQDWTVEDVMMAQLGKGGTDQQTEEMKFPCPSGGCGYQYRRINGFSMTRRNLYMQNPRLIQICQ